MREHKGWLYLSGLSSNRLGRYRIAGADSEWTSIRSYWGDVLGV
jgi:ribose transport system permease protein